MVAKKVVHNVLFVFFEDRFLFPTQHLGPLLEVKSFELHLHLSKPERNKTPLGAGGFLCIRDDSKDWPRIDIFNIFGG